MNRVMFQDRYVSRFVNFFPLFSPKKDEVPYFLALLLLLLNQTCQTLFYLLFVFFPLSKV